MKNILFVLVLTAVVAAAGFVGTAEVARRCQNARAEATEKPIPQQPSMEALLLSGQRVSRATSDLEARQGYAVIGGGVGAAVGFVLSLFIAIRADRRRKTVPDKPAGGDVR